MEVTYNHVDVAYKVAEAEHNLKLPNSLYVIN